MFNIKELMFDKDLVFISDTMFFVICLYGIGVNLFFELFFFL